MRLDRRPLLDHRGDARLVVERPELHRLLRSVELGLNVIVHGPRGSGKTTLGRHAAWRLRNKRIHGPGMPSAVEALFVSAAALETPVELLQHVLRRLGGEPRSTAGADADLALVDDVRTVVAAARDSIAVFVDDLSAPLGRAVFGRLRDEVWTLGITWVVMCAETEAASLLLPPVDAFFETDIRLGGLDAAASRDLVRHRLDDDAARPSLTDEDIDQLSTAVAGNPRQLIDAVRAVVVDGEGVGSLVAGVDARRSHLAQLTAGPVRLAAELEALGPVSPSDPELQRRMGVSRPRLVQLLRELRDAGLVEEIPAAAEGPGRPRVLYRTRPPTRSSDAMLEESRR